MPSMEHSKSTAQQVSDAWVTSSLLVGAVSLTAMTQPAPSTSDAIISLTRSPGMKGYIAPLKSSPSAGQPKSK